MKTLTFAPRTAGLGALRLRRGFLGLETPLGWRPLPMGGGAYGTLSVVDTLASASNTTVADYGEDRAFTEIEAALAAHNRITNDMLGDFVERSTDRQRRYGSADAMAMDELDEYGRADAQKLAAGATVGFPLRLYGIALQWTRKYFQTAMASELAAQTAGVMDADVKALQREVKRALFYPTNVTFTDRLVDGVSLAVKRLVNADSASIPLGPDGASFDATTHTHYLFTASSSLAAADVNALLETVIEHHATGQAVLYINRAQETALRGLAGFTAYLDARLVNGGGNIDPQARATLDFNGVMLNDRAIGIYSAGGVSAEVIIKPWVPASYLFAWVRGAPVPLVLRTRNAGSGNLELVYDDEAHPLRARGYEREFGVSVWTRTNGAALFVTGTGAYAAPTLT